MLAPRVRIAQLIELSVYVALAAWLVAAAGWSRAEGVAFVVACVLGVRLLLVVASFALTWIHRSPRPREQRIGALPTVAMVLREWVALTVFNLVSVPWESRVVRADPRPQPGAGLPVVLVHGYFANRGMFRVLVRRLEAQGVGPVFVPNLPSFFASIERFEAELAAVVERVARGTGRPVALVGHSMGGLGIRAYLVRHGTAHVDRVVMIGSPHHGTALAPLGQGENARQMRIGSDFLRELERSEGEAGPGIPALCIYSAHDNMVAPQETSRLPWARNVALAGYGHLDLAETPVVVGLLLEALR